MRHTHMRHTQMRRIAKRRQTNHDHADARRLADKTAHELRECIHVERCRAFGRQPQGNERCQSMQPAHMLTNNSQNRNKRARRVMNGVEPLVSHKQG